MKLQMLAIHRKHVIFLVVHGLQGILELLIGRNYRLKTHLIERVRVC